MDMTTPQTSQQPVDEQEVPPSAEGAAVPQPAVEQPIADPFAAERPAPEQPAPEQPAQPQAEQPVAEQPVAEQPAPAPEPVVQEPAPEPYVEQPVVVEEPQPEPVPAAEPVFDKEGQFEKVSAGLLQGEQIIAVYDIKGVGDGMVGITNMRLIIQDNSFMGGKVALTSVPYGRIHSVSYLADKSMFGKFFSESKICVSTSGHDYVMEFRSVEKARHIHDVVLAYAMGA